MGHVKNLEPKVTPLPAVLPLAEGQSFSLTGEAWDTASDMEDHSFAGIQTQGQIQTESVLRMTTVM